MNTGWRLRRAAIVSLSSFLAAWSYAAWGQQGAGTQPRSAKATMVVDVWPEGKMPGVGATGAESDTATGTPLTHKVTNVSRPTLAVFSAAKGDGPRPAMIICPGGAYRLLSMDLEGTEIATWLNGHGITGLVLKYRVPGNREGALEDVQRAIRLARAQAGEWNIDVKRVGVMGFSAGGHLAALASTVFEKRSYEAMDAADKESCRPDFVVLVYPAYLNGKDGVAPELNMKAKIPPTLIIHNVDDKTYYPSSKAYDAALTAAGVAHEYVVYQTGGHGYGLRSTKDVKAWPEAAMKWLKKNGVE